VAAPTVRLGRGPEVESTVDPQDRRATYDQICATYRAIDDFRAKLLGFLPAVTGGSLVLLTRGDGGLDPDFYAPVGAFALLVTVGLFIYELHGISKCHFWIEAGKRVETDMNLKVGLFTNRSKYAWGKLNELHAAAIIYPAVMAAWTYVALFHTARTIGLIVGVGVFLLGLATMLRYEQSMNAKNSSGHAPDDRLEEPQTRAQVANH
jgi:hypothetical protein